MATSAERMRALRERDRRGLRSFTIGVSEDDLRVIAEHGYEGAASADQDRRSQAVGLSISDTVACRDRNGWQRHVTASQPVTASPTRYRNSVVPARPPATAPPAGWSAPAAVLDCDLDLVALKKTRFSPQPLDLAANFPSRRDAALVGLQDDLRLALAHDPPGGLVR